jgi:hypothetical protein
MPITPGTPRIKPTRIGTITAMTDGTTISLSAPLVLIATHEA